MIDRVQISNFRCLRSVDAPLAPFTVLVGPNGSGKTAFLLAIQLANSVGTAQELQKHHPAVRVRPADYWRHQAPEKLSVTLHFESEKVQIQPWDQSKDKWVLSGDSKSIKPVSYFQTPKLTLSMTCPGVAENTGSVLIDDQAGNIPAVLDLLLRKHRDRFFRVVDTLRELIPGFEDLNIETPDIKTRRVDLVLDNGLTLDAADASFGVKLILFFVILANHPSPPKTILVEEPETGVHPKRLVDIVKLLRGLTEGKFTDRPTQVILSTHSPYLLDCIDVERDQVLVMRRESDGARTTEPLDKERMSVFLDEFMLGEVWYNEEEAGLTRKP